MNKYLCALLAIPLLTFVIVSCSERETYYKFKEVKGANWAVEDALIFEIDTFDVESDVQYDVSLEVTNNVDYPYQNLWIFSEYNKDDSTTIKAQKEFTLADEFGKWQGAGFASLYQSSFPVMQGIRFKQGKNYRVYLRHGMQTEVLHGIEKVGLKISKSK